MMKAHDPPPNTGLHDRRDRFGNMVRLFGGCLAADRLAVVFCQKRRI